MSDPILVPVWVPIASAFAGGIAVAITNYITNWQNRKTEERKHLKELIFKTAVENWKQHNDTAIELLKLKKSVTVMPFESHLVNLITLSDTLLDSRLTKDNAVQKVKAAFEISDEVDKYINNRFYADKNKDK